VMDGRANQLADLATVNWGGEGGCVRVLMHVRRTPYVAKAPH